MKTLWKYICFKWHFQTPKCHGHICVLNAMCLPQDANLAFVVDIRRRGMDIYRFRVRNYTMPTGVVSRMWNKVIPILRILSVPLCILLWLSINRFPCIPQHNIADTWVIVQKELGPLLLTWLDFKSSRDEESHAHYNVGWNYLSIPKLQRLHCWSLEWIINFNLHFIMDVITYSWD